MKQAEITITAASSAAAKEMAQAIMAATGATFEAEKPFGILVGGKKHGDYFEGYVSTNGKISYCEAYESDELDHVHFFNEDNDLIAKIQVEDGGADNLTAEQIAEISKALGIETNAENDASHQRALGRFEARIEQNKEQIAAREEKIAAAEAEIEGNEAEIARLTAQNEIETDRSEKRCNERDIIRLNAINNHLRHDIEEYREAIRMYEGYNEAEEARKAEYMSDVIAAERATETETANAAVEVEAAKEDGSNDEADEPEYVSVAPKFVFSESDEDDDLEDEYWTVEPAPWVKAGEKIRYCTETGCWYKKTREGGWEMASMEQAERILEWHGLKLWQYLELGERYIAPVVDSDFKTIEVINPTVVNSAPTDKLLKIRGCIFTHSPYTSAEITEYLEEIEACDAGADHIQASSEDAGLIEEFSDDYTPEEYAVTFEGECRTSTLNMIKAKVASFDNPAGKNFHYNPHYAVLKYEAEPVEDADDEPEPATEPAEEIPAPACDSDESDSDSAMVVPHDAKAETPATAPFAKRYICTTYGYNSLFAERYTKGRIAFDTLDDAVKYVLNDRDNRKASENYGGAEVVEDFEDDGVSVIMTLLEITPTGKLEIETHRAKVKQILAEIENTAASTAVELKISEAPAGESTTFTIRQSPRDNEPADNSIDSETPATETTILLPLPDGTALVKDLAGTVLEVKIAADKIEELLADGYALGDSGHASIAKAQDLLKQAMAELGKLKSIDRVA